MNELIGYDTVSKVFWVPDDCEFGVCYGDGRYENSPAAHARFPRLFQLGRFVDLTVRGALWKDPLSGTDIEPGNAGPDTAVFYVQGEHKLGIKRPDVYASTSDMRQILQNLSNAGIHVGEPGPTRPLVIYTAHPTGHKHRCGPHTCGFPVEADMTQFWWSSISGRWNGFPGDLDVNLAREDAFGAPKPLDPWRIFYPNPKFPFKINNRVEHWGERDLIVRVDGALDHPDKYGPYLKGQLRPALKFVRDRIWRIAKYQPPAFTHPRAHAAWEINHRGSRWQLINHRIQAIDAL